MWLAEEEGLHRCKAEDLETLRGVTSLSREVATSLQDEQETTQKLHLLKRPTR